MNYILVGKQSTALSGIRDRLGKDITVYNSVTEMNDNRNSESKVIYIRTSIPFDWEWWMSADVSNEFNRKRFVDELMDFKNIDSDCCDKIINYDGTGLSDVIEEIERYITEVENGSNTVFN